MGHAELGLKFTCVNCAARFYDLHRDPAVCPKCQAEQPKPKPRSFAPSRAGARAWSSKTPIAATAPEAAEAEAETEEEALDDVDAADPDLLDDDEDDAEVIAVPQEEV